MSSWEAQHSKVLLILDVTDSALSAEEMISELERLELMKVEKVIKPPVEGFVADTASHPLVAGPSRAIILRETGYRELLVGIRECFGASGENFLYHIGFRAGMGFGSLHRETAEKIGLKDPVQIYRNISAAMFQWAGFGILEVEELTADGGVIVVKDSFECSLGKRRSANYSQFVRGIIAGVLSELFGRAYNVAEEECIAMGAPACRFRVRAFPKDKPA
ncbi:MAG: 4-vinyl reductase [Thermoproteota archaeon]